MIKLPQQIRFFATKEDLMPVLEALEDKHHVKYVQLGWAKTQRPQSFPSVKALPSLGSASNESTILSNTYLICREDGLIHARPVSDSQYAFDQLHNLETVTFTPGGFWGEDILLSGRFATASTEPFSLELMKLLRSVIRKRFDRIKAFYVGKEAQRALDSGKRLAIAVQSPAALDLSRT